MTGLSRNAVISSTPSLSDACTRPIAMSSATAASIFPSRCLARNRFPRRPGLPTALPAHHGLGPRSDDPGDYAPRGTVPHQSAMKAAMVRVQRRRSSIEVRSSKACAPSPFGP